MTHERCTYAPDFYIVGAAKAGTTALWTWLADHPGIFMPDTKEPGYFTYAGLEPKPASGLFDPDYVSRITSSAQDYENLYALRGDKLAGDASVVYLTDPEAARRISESRPDARILILLRDPVDRAFSQYMHHRRDGLDPCQTFDQALAEEPRRIAEGWSWAYGYAMHGHYPRLIEPFLEQFPRDQVLFVDYREIQTTPHAVWRRVCSFLGVDPCDIAANRRVNATANLQGVSARPGVTRWLRHPGSLQRSVKKLVPSGVRRILRGLIEGKSDAVPVLDPETQRRLAARFEHDLPLLRQMTGLPLESWLMYPKTSEAAPGPGTGAVPVGS